MSNTSSIYVESPDQVALHVAQRLKRYAFVVLGVELRPTVRHNGLLVNVTLGKSLNLANTYVVEQFIGDELKRLTKHRNILFFWRYVPRQVAQLRLDSVH